jgi:hypothetical protein
MVCVYLYGAEQDKGRFFLLFSPLLLSLFFSSSIFHLHAFSLSCLIAPSQTQRLVEDRDGGAAAVREPARAAQGGRRGACSAMMLFLSANTANVFLTSFFLPSAQGALPLHRAVKSADIEVVRLVYEAYPEAMSGACLFCSYPSVCR